MAQTASTPIASRVGISASNNLSDGPNTAFGLFNISMMKPWSLAQVPDLSTPLLMQMRNSLAAWSDEIQSTLLGRLDDDDVIPQLLSPDVSQLSTAELHQWYYYRQMTYTEVHRIKLQYYDRDELPMRWVYVEELLGKARAARYRTGAYLIMDNGVPDSALSADLQAQRAWLRDSASDGIHWAIEEEKRLQEIINNSIAETLDRTDIRKMAHQIEVAWLQTQTMLREARNLRACASTPDAVPATSALSVGENGSQSTAVNPSDQEHVRSQSVRGSHSHELRHTFLDDSDDDIPPIRLPEPARGYDSDSDDESEDGEDDIVFRHQIRLGQFGDRSPTPQPYQPSAPIKSPPEAVNRPQSPVAAARGAPNALGLVLPSLDRPREATAVVPLDLTAPEASVLDPPSLRTPILPTRPVDSRSPKEMNVLPDGSGHQDVLARDGTLSASGPVTNLADEVQDVEKHNDLVHLGPILLETQENNGRVSASMPSEADVPAVRPLLSALSPTVGDQSPGQSESTTDIAIQNIPHPMRVVEAPDLAQFSSTAKGRKRKARSDDDMDEPTSTADFGRPTKRRKRDDTRDEVAVARGRRMVNQLRIHLVAQQGRLEQADDTVVLPNRDKELGQGMMQPMPASTMRHNPNHTSDGDEHIPTAVYESTGQNLVERVHNNIERSAASSSQTMLLPVTAQTSQRMTRSMTRAAARTRTTADALDAMEKPTEGASDNTEKTAKKSTASIQKKVRKAVEAVEKEKLRRGRSNKGRRK
ncbi:hypothetical protein CALCODRAFT_521870 [Calocera cornea HHB12733]|uniref:Uncharacterized protein n=1 Tax=Calocera cornea HHB12733 TaxID=1353952 RepID=A0A165CCX0_9BASI|nr:hypothetical protein CALCODRAFT_521870 [Calocera cornea HHB12733]